MRLIDKYYTSSKGYMDSSEAIANNVDKKIHE